MRLRIVLIIPLVLVLLSTGFSLMFYFVTNGQAANIIRNQDLLKVKLDITRLQNILYSLLTEDATDLETARLNLSVTAMDNNIKKLLVTAENDVVLIANRYNWENLSANSISGYKNIEAKKIKLSNHQELIFADEEETLLIGYYPVVIKLENVEGFPIKQRGVLYIEYSMENKLLKAKRVALNQSATIGMVLFGVSFVIGLMLHMLVSRRLSKLTLVAKEISKGNLELKSNLRGNDELGALSSAFDEMIDRRKIAEKELRHVNENLEEIVEQRSDELEEKKQELLETQAHAHHASKMSALGEMAGGMAHEINSPLQAITLLTYKLKKANLSTSAEQRSEIANRIDETVYRISNIIESLRKMSRGSSSDPFEVAALKDIVDNVIGITKERYFIKGIILKIIYHDNSETVEAECQQTLIGQIIINLLNNAYDAVKELEEKWIKLEIFSDDEKVDFVVTDSGKGISEELREKIFDPMFTTKSIDEGTGLGLSLSLEIARKHNGSLTVDASSINTRFILSIPRFNKGT